MSDAVVDNNDRYRAATDALRLQGGSSEGSGGTNNPIAFQVLGPTEARQSGLLIPLSGVRRRALVTRLLLNAGRAVSAETLLEDVWDGQIPSAASATLQSHVSQLRKVLGECLQRSATGYVLHLDAAVVDAAEFEVRIASGVSRMTAGDAQAAAGSFREALGLWRGRALQDVADRPWGPSRGGAPRGASKSCFRAASSGSAGIR